MRRIFRKPDMTKIDPNPNLQDTINRLSIPPLDEVVHEAQQTAYGDPAESQDKTQVDLVTSEPSFSALLDSIDPTMSTAHDQMLADVFCDSTATNTSTAQGYMQQDISIAQGQALNKRNVQKIGPWGGQGGRTWEWDGTVQNIFVNHGTAVYSIAFESIENGTTVWFETFGGGDGDDGELCEISIKEPEEYLVAIRGTTGIFRYPTPVVTSLSFVSNKRSYGPFGKDTTNQFSVPMYERKIVGFHGRCGGLLDAIGIDLAPLDLPKPIPQICSYTGGNIMRIGPWGGQGGVWWEWDRPIHKIILRHGLVIDSITLGSIQNGVTVWSKRFGGDGGGELTKMSIEEPEEYLVSIRATIGRAISNVTTPLVTSLTFVSNKRDYGPFGRVSTGELFCIPRHGRKIVGFVGRSGSYLDAIGFNLGPLGLP